MQVCHDSKIEMYLELRKRFVYPEHGGFLVLDFNRIAVIAHWPRPTYHEWQIGTCYTDFFRKFSKINDTY
jgi:hypothetical protein